MAVDPHSAERPVVLSDDTDLTSVRVTAAISEFFFRGRGPSHTAISRVLTQAGWGDDFVFTEGGTGPNKQQRVTDAFSRARRRPGSGRHLLEGMLGILSVHGALTGPGEGDSKELATLRQALAATYHRIDEGLRIRRVGNVDLETGGRPALEQQLDRMRRASGDTALLLGTSKEVLESTAKLVLEQVQGHDRQTLSRMSFPQLWHLSRECLGILPNQVDANLPNHASIRKLYQAMWQIAEQVNDLRNDQGTGHGDVLPLGISDALAKLVVRDVCIVAEFMLDSADKLVGRER